MTSSGPQVHAGQATARHAPARGWLTRAQLDRAVGEHGSGPGLLARLRPLRGASAVGSLRRAWIRRSAGDIAGAQASLARAASFDAPPGAHPVFQRWLARWQAELERRRPAWERQGLPAAAIEAFVAEVDRSERALRAER